MNRGQLSNTRIANKSERKTVTERGGRWTKLCYKQTSDSDNEGGGKVSRRTVLQRHRCEKRKRGKIEEIEPESRGIEVDAREEEEEATEVGVKEEEEEESIAWKSSCPI